MLWYAAEPLAEVNAQRMLQMAEKAKSPSFLKYAIQRVGALNTPKSSTLLQDLGKRLNEKNTEESHMAQAAIDSILIK